ncbi:retrovirus-related pol polyprotein from transposon TNT 1-94 [Tanacetum coccineum]|uniref:Retrovirus-related pol polyprotein from transposon TNT 1-94 n=1 Tax=Tanacetum coccineum TaxID=301880 RepID=A0ABQ4YSA3_9ASTR
MSDAVMFQFSCINKIRPTSGGISRSSLFGSKLMEKYKPTRLRHIRRTKPTRLAHQGLRRIQKMNKGALDLYVGNVNRAAVEAIGSFDLTLPSGMILVLDNCHFAPSITKRVISLSRLWDNAFLHKFTDNGAISVYKDNLFYFNAILRDGIFGIDMHDHVCNDHSIYTCSNKKSKQNLDSTFLWHFRLAHINKKHIAKLQHDGLLESTDDESFDVCVSCISGKMARKPFTHAIERADDLLGLIHSDLCGPFRTTSREESAARILNMVPTKKVNKTPYEIWHRKISNLSYLKVWGCEALVKRDMANKLESRAIKCIFIGYLKEMMGYYFYYPTENKIFIARYAEYFERNLISQEASGSTIELMKFKGKMNNLQIICHTPKPGLVGTSVRWRDVIIFITQDQGNDH